jgi:hypothetical protein
MAGLIQQQMGARSKEDETMEREPVEGKGPDGSAMHEGMEGEQPEANDASAQAGEDNPVFQQAMTFAYEALYAKEAAKDVAQQLKSAPGLADGMADVAYNITSIIDEKTQGQVPDELIVPLAMNVLEEVGEIAEAAGLAPQAEDVAMAFKTMILRYLGEQGVDTTQLQQAMDQVDPSEFRKVAEQA